MKITAVPLLLGSLFIEGTFGVPPQPGPPYGNCLDAFQGDQNFCKKWNYVFKDGVFNHNPCPSNTCGIEDCCAKMCNDEVCRHYKSLVLKDHPPPCKNTHCEGYEDVDNCCVPTCSSFWAYCGKDMEPKPGHTKCASDKCTADDCCAPKCPHDICDGKDYLSRKRHPLPCMGQECTESECCDSMCTFGLDYPMHGVPGSSNKVEDDPSTGDEGRGRQLAKAPEKPKKAACCPDTCINTAGEYQCGGENCEHIKGGPNSCCVQDINAKGESCNDPHVHGPPCSIPSPCPKGICKKKGLKEKTHQPLVCDGPNGKCTEFECCDSDCKLDHPEITIEGGVLGTTDDGKTACCAATCVNHKGEYQCGGEGCAHVPIEGLPWNKDSASLCCIGTIGEGDSCVPDPPTTPPDRALEAAGPTAPCFVPDKCTADKCDPGSVLSWEKKDELCDGIHCTSDDCCIPAPTCGQHFNNVQPNNPCGMGLVPAKDDKKCHGHECTDEECCEERICPVTVPYHYEYLNLKDVKADCFDNAPKVLPQYVVGRIVGVTIPAEALVPTGHPDSSDSYDDGGQVIRFKCESHFDKRDRRMSDKISAEDFGVISEDWSTDFLEVISAAFSYKGGFRHLADSDEGDDRGEAKKIGGGGEGVASMPPTGPPTTFCLSDGNEWKVGEDLHLIVYPDAGPFKISFMDRHNLCKDTIHFEADDPHCPISECPEDMFYFDKDEVEVQTEPHGFCDGHAPVKVKIGEDALSMDGECGPCLTERKSKGSWSRKCKRCEMKMLSEAGMCPSKEKKSFILDQEGYKTESLPLWDLEDGIHAHLFPNVSTTLTLIHESTPLKCKEVFEFTPTCVETPLCEANGIPGVQGKSKAGVACCALTCKNEETGELECGGEQCGSRDKEGGKSSCCIKEIVEHGPSCDARGATSPCRISGPHYPGPAPTEPHYSPTEPYYSPTEPHYPHPNPAPWPHPAPPTKPHPAPTKPQPAPTKPHPPYPQPAPEKDICDYYRGIPGGNHRGDVCCPLHCEKNGCGGKTCGDYPGNRDDCCINVVINKAPACGPHDKAPCVLKDPSPPPTPRPYPAPTPRPYPAPTPKPYPAPTPKPRPAPAPKPEVYPDICDYGRFPYLEGIKAEHHKGDVCCPLHCKKNGCGGKNCGEYPGNRDDCCIGVIVNKAPTCGPHEKAPCVLRKPWW